MIPAKVAGIAIMAVYDVLVAYKDLIIQKALAENKMAFESQIYSSNITGRWSGEIIKSHDSTVSLVLNDLQVAIDRGYIPTENMNVADLSKIANIVLFGGNGDEGKEIVTIGEKIINEISGGVASTRLAFRKRYKKELENNTETNTDSSEPVCIPCAEK